MRPMNIEFLSEMARKEKEIPIVCSEVNDAEKMFPMGALVWKFLNNILLYCMKEASLISEVSLSPRTKNDIDKRVLGCLRKLRKFYDRGIINRLKNFFSQWFDRLYYF